MKVKIKSILSLSLIFTFFVFPLIAIDFNGKDENESIEQTKETNLKEDEVPTIKPTTEPKVEVVKEVVKETTPTPRPTTRPTPNTRKSSVKANKTKKINKTKQTKKNGTFYLSDYERRVVECMVMGESGGESYKGQTLVAFCILNACKKDGLQPSEVRRVYKYSGWNTNPNKSVKKAISEVFDNGYKPVNDTPLYFYAPKYCNSAWHETQRYICTVGGHKFFGRW